MIVCDINLRKTCNIKDILYISIDCITLGLFSDTNWITSIFSYDVSIELWNKHHDRMQGSVFCSIPSQVLNILSGMCTELLWINIKYTANAGNMFLYISMHCVGILCNLKSLHSNITLKRPRDCAYNAVDSLGVITAKTTPGISSWG